MRHIKVDPPTGEKIHVGFHYNLVFLHLLEELWDGEQPQLRIPRVDGLRVLTSKLKATDDPAPDNAWSQMVSFVSSQKETVQTRVSGLQGVKGGPFVFTVTLEGDTLVLEKQ